MYIFCNSILNTHRRQIYKARCSIFFTLAILLMAGLAVNSSAETVTGCHCFKNRSFDPAARFAADDYILATSFNSLLAKAFNIPKRQVVMLKIQGGVSHNDLLITLKTSQATKTDLSEIIILRKQNLSWQKILASLALHSAIEKDKVLQAIQSGLPENAAGPRVADELLISFFGVANTTVTKLRQSGLNEKEMALLFVLSRTKNLNPEKLATEYQNGGKSWGEIANNLGISPKQAGQLIMSYGPTLRKE